MVLTCSHTGYDPWERTGTLTGMDTKQAREPALEEAPKLYAIVVTGSNGEMDPHLAAAMEEVHQASLSNPDNMPLPVPGMLPPLSRAVSDERIVHRVAGREPRDGRGPREGRRLPGCSNRTGRWHPLRCPHRLEVRVEPFPREAVGDHLVIDA